MKPADRALYSTSRTEPVYSADQAVAELCFAGQFAVWALRVHWTSAGSETERGLLLQRAFDVLCIPEGGMLVARLAQALADSSSRPLSVPCPSWRVLTKDEARLLNFLAALQGRDGSPMAVWNTTETETERHSPRGSSAIWAPSQRLALAFSAAGLYFSLPRFTDRAAPLAMPLLH